MMALKGMLKETYRLPLCPMSDDLKAAAKKVMQDMGIL